MLAFFILVIVFLLLPTQIKAVVVINEVHPNPLTGEAEWIELYNSESTNISLESWRLEDVLSSPSIIHHFSSNTVIEANGYLTLDLPTQKLNNNGDGVRLFDHHGNLIDSMDYSSSEADKSWSLLQSNIWQLTTPTRNSANSPPAPSPEPSPNPVPTTTPMPNPSPSPTPTPQPITDLHITSFSPCPLTGSLENIAIRNNSDRELTISNWIVKDRDGNIKYLSAALPAHQHTTLSWTGSLLNNTGDSITVTTDKGVELLSTEYGECERGEPFQFVNNQWTQATTTVPLPSHQTLVTRSSVSSLKQDVEELETDSDADIMINNGRLIQLASLAASPSGVIISHEKPEAEPVVPILESREPVSKTGITHVIIGGLLISLSGALPLYEKTRLLQTPFLG